MKSEIPIVMVSNDTYLPYAAVAIKSMIDTKEAYSQYRIYILCLGIDADAKLDLIAMSRSDVIITIRDISMNLAPYINKFYSRAHYTREMYFRWWIGELFPEYEKVLYLDCDVVVMCDLLPLYKTDLGTAVVSGVVDFATPKFCRRLSQQFGLSAEKYINSGVLLINSSAWRTENLAEKCVTILGHYDKLVCPDQDVLNLVCKNRILYLDARWNVQWHHLWDPPNNQLEEPFLGMFDYALANPKILHFSSPTKPWNNPQAPYSEYFWRHAVYFSDSNLSIIKR